MENVWKYRTIKWERAQKYVSQTEIKIFTIFHEHLVAMEVFPIEILFDKPLHIGACILDLCKTVMYLFHHDYIRTPRISQHLTPRFCYMDIDSFTLQK